MIKIKTGVSARHFHISENTLKLLFGLNYKLNLLKPLTLPGQYAAKETIKVIGEKDFFSKIRIIGPIRKKDQLELSITDCIKLGINPVVRESGNIKNTPGIKIEGAKGQTIIKEGVIVAARHIHLSVAFASKYNIKEGQIVKIKTEGKRSLIFNNVIARISSDFIEEFHIDVDEANSAMIKNGSYVFLIK